MEDLARPGIRSRGDPDVFPLSQTDVVAGLVGKGGEEALRTSVGVQRDPHHPAGLQDAKHAVLLLPPKPQLLQRAMRLDSSLRDGWIGLDEKDALVRRKLPEGLSEHVHAPRVRPIQEGAPRNGEEAEAGSGNPTSKAQRGGADLLVLRERDEEGLPTGLRPDGGPGAGLHQVAVGVLRHERVPAGAGILRGHDRTQKRWVGCLTHRRHAATSSRTARMFEAIRSELKAAARTRPLAANESRRAGSSRSA